MTKMGVPLSPHSLIDEVMGTPPKKKFISVPDTKLSEIRPVGNYAIEFRWEDGHNAGIYTFDYLRSLCPCTQCNNTHAEP